MIPLHTPVMTEEVLRFLACRPAGVYVDATLGDGGHAAAICRVLGPGGCLIGIDWDAAALARARENLAEFAGMIDLVHDSYTVLPSILERLGLERVDGILLDLGVSTLQLADPARGFSYHQDQPLDMRMDPRLPRTAADLVNSLPKAELARLIYRYGEERWAGRIASRVAARREKYGPLKTCGALVAAIKEAIPAAARRAGGHPARRTFQALRIAVNGELDNLEMFLPRAVDCLEEEGRLCVIAYHSLEDRIVKHFFQDRARRCRCPAHLPCTCGGAGELKLLTPRAIKPEAAEVARNPRSRSARLRAVQRVLKKKEGE